MTGKEAEFLPANSSDYSINKLGGGLSDMILGKKPTSMGGSVKILGKRLPTSMGGSRKYKNKSSKRSKKPNKTQKSKGGGKLKNIFK